MSYVNVKLSSKNQIVVPFEVRNTLDVKNGDRLTIVKKGNVAILMKTPESYSEAMSGALHGRKGKTLLKKVKTSREEW